MESDFSPVFNSAQCGPGEILETSQNVIIIDIKAGLPTHISNFRLYLRGVLSLMDILIKIEYFVDMETIISHTAQDEIAFDKTLNYTIKTSKPRLRFGIMVSLCKNRFKTIHFMIYISVMESQESIET